MGTQETLLAELGIEHAVAYVNPASDKAKKAETDLRQIEERHNLPITIIESSADWERARDDFHTRGVKELGKKTLLLACGGDGLGNLLVKLMDDEETPSFVRETPMAFTYNGGAGDTAKGLNSAKLLKEPYAIFSDPNARVENMYPLRQTFQTPDGEQTEVFVSYSGLGTTAAGAAAMNQAKPSLQAMADRHRYMGGLLRRAREPGIVIPPACESPTFTLIEPDSQHPQKSEHIMEWLIGNGPLMARYGHFQTNHLSKKVCISTVQTRLDGVWRGPKVVSNGLILAAGKLPAEQYDMTHGPRTWEIQDIQDGVLLGQVDGETFKMSEGPVTISQASPLRVITTIEH
jgi:hypothetical protein